MSCDSLTFGGNAFQSLLAKNVKDRCINFRLKGGRSSLVLSPRKLFGTTLKLYLSSLKLYLLQNLDVTLKVNRLDFFDTVFIWPFPSS